jgi:ParE-like toxin of type II ParDE toxin-antitoxin system
VPEFVFEEDADSALRALEADPGQHRLVSAIAARLALLEDRPSSKENRRTGYAGGLWRIDVRDHMILWQMRDDLIVVRYIGPAL